MNDQEYYKDHLGSLLSHLRYQFTIHDISSVFIDGNFIETGFCVKVKNEMKSDSVSTEVELHFDKRGYMFGFSFNVPFATAAIVLEFNEEFSAENSHAFIDLAKYFMQNISPRMNDVMIEEMDFEGIKHFWEVCLSKKELA